MRSVPLLDLKAQHAAIREEIAAALAAVVDSQSFILGQVVARFEEEAARYLGGGHAVGCASGTDALILSLAALGIGPGDEVLTTPFSFFATASCAYKVGARPRFVDIDETWNMDPGRLEAAATPRTRAILPVHLFGQCADMDPILEVARRLRVSVVEDAAQAFGATYLRGDARIPAGRMGTLGCYSFFPTKNLGAYGDGGMIVSDDPALAEKLRHLRVHGESARYHHSSVGWNSRLDALQAAVLRVKLPRLASWCEARRANAARYDRLFEEAGLVRSGRVHLPLRSPRSEHIFNQYTLRVENRAGLLEHLSREGIGHAVYYPVPLHLQECFRDLGYREGDFPAAERASREVVSLPVYAELPVDDQQHVVETIERFYR